MSKNEFTRLTGDESFLNYCFGRNPDDVAYWENWLTENPGAREQIQEVKDMIIVLGHQAQIHEVKENFALLQQSIQEGKLQSHPEPFRIHRLSFKLAVAASILVFLAIGSYFYLRQQTKQQIAQNQPDIKPGSNKAILILSNGQQVILTNAKNGRLAQQGNVVINKTADGKVVYDNAASDNITADAGYNTYQTPSGGKFNIVLPDGTQAWLNDTSSIKFPIHFANNERTVEITGEVYFEVAHDAGKPFRVSASGQKVEVLGTHFNINAYPDEANIKTTLLEGSVKVTKGAAIMILKPGQQAQVSFAAANTDINLVANANIDEAIAWTKGYFRFKHADLPAIMRQLARWYDITVSYEGAIPKRAFTGKISRDVNLSEALQILKFFKVHYKIEHKHLTIIP